MAGRSVAQGSHSVLAVRKPRGSIPSAHLLLVCPSLLAAYPAVDSCFNPLMKLKSLDPVTLAAPPSGKKPSFKQLSLWGPLCRMPFSVAEQQSSLQSILNVLERRMDPCWTKLDFNPGHKCFLFPFCSACFHMVSMKARA